VRGGEEKEGEGRGGEARRGEAIGVARPVCLLVLTILATGLTDNVSSE